MPNIYKLTSDFADGVFVDTLQKNYGMHLIDARVYPKGEMQTVEGLGGKVYTFMRNKNEACLRFYNPGDYIDVGTIRKHLEKYNKRRIMKDVNIVSEMEGSEYKMEVLGYVTERKDRLSVVFKDQHVAQLPL